MSNVGTPKICEYLVFFWSQDHTWYLSLIKPQARRESLFNDMVSMQSVSSDSITQGIKRLYSEFPGP